ncbi:MAG: hypothetical protein PF450_09140 [Bacteroidales bacterium]|jgi:hypothetical protein|nr:hypothetical protein [Bacteroidales bacterium]
MKLPEKDYYGISDILKRWNKSTKDDFKYEDVLEYIRQGKLKIKLYSDGTYSPVSKSHLCFFDVRYIDASAINNFDELMLTHLNNPSVEEFADGVDFSIKTKLKDIYVHISELITFEGKNSPTIPNSEKPIANLTERNKLSTIILALANHAKIDITDTGKAAIVIKQDAQFLGINITRNTIVKHLDNALDFLHREVK